MRNNILLISKNKDMLSRVSQLIDPSKYALSQSSAIEIMQKIFMTNPFYLIVDVDEITAQTIQVIKSVQDLDYVPTMYVGHNTSTIEYRKTFPNDLIVNIESLPAMMDTLLSQGLLFKQQYNKVSEAYETIDTLTSETKEVMDRYLLKDFGDFGFSSREVVNVIFADNPILTNKPDHVWVVYPEHTGRLIALFSHEENGEGYEEVYEGLLSEEDVFSFDVFAENGFKMNCEEERFSDIDQNTRLFPDQMISKLPYLSNFAGFGMDQIIVIGCNYKEPVTSYESSVLKSMTVTLDLLENIRYQVHEVEGAFNYTLDALARAAEASDDMTGQHIRRVNEYSKFIAKKLKLDNQFVKDIYNTAQMHDVGKIYVDNQILQKRGKLTDREFREMQLHTVYGQRIIGQSEYLQMAAEIALSHHEKMDGTGYPNGTKGEDIPLSARIVMLADIYDALRSERTYKPGFSHDQTIEIILKGDGRVEPKHFDPEVWRVFKDHHDEFNKIFSRLNG